MGRLDFIDGWQVYLDTNLFIYALEFSETYTAKVLAVFSRIHATRCLAVTSQLTLAECLVKPFKMDDSSSIAKYKQSIKSSHFLKVVDINQPILLIAAQNKAHSQNKLPGAIHLATAIESGCWVFVTNDKRITVPEGMVRFILDEL